MIPIRIRYTLFTHRSQAYAFLMLYCSDRLSTDESDRRGVCGLRSAVTLLGWSCLGEIDTGMAARAWRRGKVSLTLADKRQSDSNNFWSLILACPD